MTHIIRESWPIPTLDAYVVSWPTSTKNLERTLANTAQGRTWCKTYRVHHFRQLIFSTKYVLSNKVNKNKYFKYHDLVRWFHESFFFPLHKHPACFDLLRTNFCCTKNAKITIYFYRKSKRYFSKKLSRNRPYSWICEIIWWADHLITLFCICFVRKLQLTLWVSIKRGGS